MKPPTYRIELFKGKKLKLDQDRHPVCLTVTFKGKVKRKTIASALPKEWDSKNDLVKPRSRKDWERVNTDIETEYTKYLSVFNALKRDLETFTVEKVFEEQKVISPLFKRNAEMYLEELRSRSQHSYDSANSRLRKIMEYSGVEDFRISEIDDTWIKGFKAFCKKKGNSHNTINYALKFIVRIGSYAGVKIKTTISFDKTYKEKLTPEELLRFSIVDSKDGTHEWHAKNTFMLQFYFRGMRIGDLLLLKKSNFKNDRLIYDSSKTNEDYSIKIIEPCREILNLYTDTQGVYLLPWIRTTSTDKEVLSKEVKNRTAVINWHLKEIAKKSKPAITKNITTHIARHTFAAIADKKLNRDVKAIQSLLGHGNRKMTEIYLGELRKTDELDDAADLVFGE